MRARENVANMKRSVVLAMVLVVAFLLGYKKDALWAFFQNPSPTTPSTPPLEATVEEVAKEEPVSKTLPSQKIAPPSARPAIPPKDKNTTVPVIVPPENPYAEMMKRMPQRPAENFEKTIDSISAGGIQEQQTQKRNLYFEKLSQQLKELQGEHPPVVGKKPEQKEEASEDEGKEEIPQVNGEAPALLSTPQQVEEFSDPLIPAPDDQPPATEQDIIQDEDSVDDILDEAGF